MSRGRTKPVEYKCFKEDGTIEILHYNDVKDYNVSGFPTTYFEGKAIEAGIPAYILFELVNLCNTRGEARRLLKQGGGYKHVHGTNSPVQFVQIGKFSDNISLEDFEYDFLFLRAGKTKLHKIQLT